MSTSTTGRVSVGTAAQRPAGGAAGDLWFATDTFVFSYYTGAAWKNFVEASDVTVTSKSGSGSGNYTTSSTSYTDVDGTNLAYTVTVPSGYKLVISLSGTISNAVAPSESDICIADDTTTLAEVRWYSGNVGGGTMSQPFHIEYVFTGDGASHTFKARFHTDSGVSASAVINNSTSTNKPFMTFTLIPSN